MTFQFLRYFLWSTSFQRSHHMTLAGHPRGGGGHPGAPPAPLGWPAIHMCVVSHHINLLDDLAVSHLQRRLDQHTVAVRVLARLPERHPILANYLPLEAVRGLLPEGRPQVLGDLRLPAKLEGYASLGLGIDDAQIRLLGVEAEDEVRVAALDSLTHGPKVQTPVSLALCHFVYLLPAAPSGTLCLTDAPYDAEAARTPVELPVWGTGFSLTSA